MNLLLGYFSLFLSALLAATLFPASSELFLYSLLQNPDYSIIALFFFATLGNTLGSCINWYLGRYLESFKAKRWFPVNETQLKKAQSRFSRYGYPVLLLSFVPIIGDPLTIIAGLMRVNFWLFLLLVTISKGGRYLFIIYIGGF